MNARYTVNLQDAEGARATATANVTLVGTATATEIAADLATFATNVAAISAAQVISMEASLISTAAPVGTVPGDFDDSDISEVAGISFKVGTTGKLWSLVIPARRNSLVVAGGLDSTSSAYTALAAEMSAAGTYSTFTSAEWVALGDVKRTFLSHRKHRKQDFRDSNRVIS